MFKTVSRPSGPSEYLACGSCGTTFEVDRLTGKNTVTVMVLRATNNRGGQGLAGCLAPKCPTCGNHRPSEG